MRRRLPDQRDEVCGPITFGPPWMFGVTSPGTPALENINAVIEERRPDRQRGDRAGFVWA